MFKKYRVVLCTPFSSAEESIIRTREFLESVKRDFNQDPLGYEKKHGEMIARLRNWENVAKKIAQILGVDIATAENFFDTFIITQEIGIPAAINSLTEILDKTPEGVLGNQVFEFINYYFLKTKDIESVKNDLIKDFGKISSISKELKISTAVLFPIFLEAIKNNNFAKIWNLIQISPILKVDFKTRGPKKISQDDGVAEKLVSDVADISKVNLDLSVKGKLLNDLEESRNKVEYYYNEVLKNLDIIEVNRSIKFNNDLANDIKINPGFYQNLNDNHTRSTGNFWRLRSVWDQVKSGTMQAPGDSTPPPKKETGSSFSKKIRITIAQPFNAQATPAGGVPALSTPPMNPANTIDTNKVREFYSVLDRIWNNLDNAEKLMQESKKHIDEFMTSSFNELKASELEVVVLSLDTPKAKKEIEKWFKYYNLFNQSFDDFKAKLMLLPSNSTEIVTDQKFKNQLNDFNTLKFISKKEFDTDSEKFKIYYVLVDDIKELEDSISLYKTYQESIKPKSAKFRVKFNFVDKRDGKVYESEMERYSFINWVYHLGLDIVAHLDYLATAMLSAASSENTRRSAISLRKKAIKFKTDNQNWAEQNMDVQAPLVEEFRK